MKSIFSFSPAVCALAFVPFATGAVASTHSPWNFSFIATGEGVKVKPVDQFGPERGFGFDLSTAPHEAGTPFFFSVTLPEGNYRVSVTFGDQAAASNNTVKAESRQLVLDGVETKPGEYVTRDFLVNVR